MRPAIAHPPVRSKMRAGLERDFQAERDRAAERGGEGGFGECVLVFMLALFQFGTSLSRLAGVDFSL